MSSSSWADVVDEEETQEIEAVETSAVAKPQAPKLQVLKNLTELNFIFDRRIDTLVFVDLDGLKKGVGKGTYNFINGSLDHSTAVLLFRRAAHHEEHENTKPTKAQKRRSKHDKGAASSVRVVCATCKNSLLLRPHLGSTRFLIESPHDQPTGTRLLMSFYISHVVARFQKLSRTSTAIYVVTPEQGAAEAVDLAKKMSPEQKIEQVAVETLESFPSAQRPTLVVVPTREKFVDQLPGDSGLDTARKRVLKFFTESRNLPTTKGALEAALQPFCRLRGDVDSWSVVDLLKTRKVWAQCDDVCGTFYYPKKKEAKDESKPKKAAPGLNKHADKVDPYLKSGQKVVTAALAVLPPQDQWEQIQRVREAHDKAFQRWPPHINLLFPFVPSDEFDAIAPKMEAALQDFGPIRVTLASFSYFSHSKTSKTLFCDPDDESKAALKRVYARLEAAFPFCVNAGHDGFTPHLTLGQFGSDAAVKAMIEQLSKDWQPVQWTLTHVSCLARTGDTPFEERRTYEFKGTPGQVPSAVQDEDSPEEQVYRRVVSELQGLLPAQRPRSMQELNTFVRKLVPGTEVPLADLMTLLFERDVITLKKDLNIEERLTPVVVNNAALARLERPASEKMVTDPADPAAAAAANAPAASTAFIKAAVYGGSKPGYAFRMGDSGLGYYLEKKA